MMGLLMQIAGSSLCLRCFCPRHGIKSRNSKTLINKQICMDKLIKLINKFSVSLWWDSEQEMGGGNKLNTFELIFLSFLSFLQKYRAYVHTQCKHKRIIVHLSPHYLWCQCLWRKCNFQFTFGLPCVCVCVWLPLAGTGSNYRLTTEKLTLLRCVCARTCVCSSFTLLFFFSLVFSFSIFYSLYHYY